MGKKESLIIIDDEPDICLLLQRLLSPYFEHIYIRHSIAEGLRLNKSVKPSILLLDNNLADGASLGTIPVFKADHPEGKVIMFSAMNIAAEALERGADAFLLKPVSIQSIRQIISEF